MPFKPVKIESVETAQELDFTVVSREQKDGESVVISVKLAKLDAADFVLLWRTTDSMSYLGTKTDVTSAEVLREADDGHSFRINL
jgi:hypothetical protein